MRIRLSVLALAVFCAGTSLSPSPVQAQGDKPLLFGFATHWDLIDDDVAAISSLAGSPPALYQAFWNLSGDDLDHHLYNGLESYFGMGMTPFIEISTEDFAGFLSGAQGAKLDQFARVIDDWTDAGSGRYVLVAPFPEANLIEHEWGGDPDGYRAAYAAVRDSFAAAGIGPDRVRFLFAMNGISSRGLSYEQFYPGDDAVDIIGFSKLNRGGSDWRDYDVAFGLHIQEMRAEVSRVKPLLITQTGSVDDSSGNRGQWLNDMFNGLPAEDQVIGAVYFNRDKDVDFRVVASGTAAPELIDGIAAWAPQADVAWVFDGRMDSWVDARAEAVTFDDVGGSQFVDEIVWVAEQGISLGCREYHYCPDEPVTRGQMASFLARALDLPSSTIDYFDDDHGSAHEDNINKVAEAGISLGCGSGQYCESDLVTRGQMASFLARALSLPPSADNWFTDDAGSTHETNIDRVAEAGITFGCGPDVYCPGDFVSRGQMAAFLYRSLLN